MLRLDAPPASCARHFYPRRRRPVRRLLIRLVRLAQAERKKRKKEEEEEAKEAAKWETRRTRTVEAKIWWWRPKEVRAREAEAPV